MGDAEKCNWRIYREEAGHTIYDRDGREPLEKVLLGDHLTLAGQAPHILQHEDLSKTNQGG